MAERLFKATYNLLEPVLTVFDTYRHVKYIDEHRADTPAVLAGVAGQFKFSAIKADQVDAVKAQLVPGKQAQDLVPSLVPTYAKIAQFKPLDHVGEPDAYQYLKGFLTGLRASVRPEVRAEVTDDAIEKFSRISMLYSMAPKAIASLIQPERFMEFFNSVSNEDVADPTVFFSSSGASSKELEALKQKNQDYQAQLASAKTELDEFKRNSLAVGLDPVARQLLETKVATALSYSQGEAVDNPDDDVVKALCEFGFIGLQEIEEDGKKQKVLSRPELDGTSYPFLTEVGLLPEDPESLSKYLDVSKVYAQTQKSAVLAEITDVKEKLKAVSHDALSNPDSASKARSLSRRKQVLEAVSSTSEREIDSHLKVVKGVLDYNQALRTRDKSVYQEKEALMNRYTELEAKMNAVETDRDALEKVSKKLLVDKKRGSRAPVSSKLKPQKTTLSAKTAASSTKDMLGSIRAAQEAFKKDTRAELHPDEQTAEDMTAPVKGLDPQKVLSELYDFLKYNGDSQIKTVEGERVARLLAVKGLGTVVEQDGKKVFQRPTLSFEHQGKTESQLVFLDDAQLYAMAPDMLVAYKGAFDQFKRMTQIGDVIRGVRGMLKDKGYLGPKVTGVESDEGVPELFQNADGAQMNLSNHLAQYTRLLEERIKSIKAPVVLDPVADPSLAKANEPAGKAAMPVKEIGSLAAAFNGSKPSSTCGEAAMAPCSGVGAPGASAASANPATDPQPDALAVPAAGKDSEAKPTPEDLQKRANTALDGL